MRGFAYGLSFAFISAMLLASGFGHVVRFARFRSILRDHGIVPRAGSGPIAALVTGLELLIGTAFAIVLVVRSATADIVVPTASAALGAAFLVYLDRLLRQPPRALSCGCSFLSGQLTPASLVPGVSLLLVSLMAFASALAGGKAFLRAGDASSAALAIAWGATLAVLVLALPAVVAPRVPLEGL